MHTEQYPRYCFELPEFWGHTFNSPNIRGCFSSEDTPCPLLASKSLWNAAAATSPDFEFGLLAAVALLGVLVVKLTHAFNILRVVLLDRRSPRQRRQRLSNHDVQTLVAGQHRAPPFA